MLSQRYNQRRLGVERERDGERDRGGGARARARDERQTRGIRESARETEVEREKERANRKRHDNNTIFFFPPSKYLFSHPTVEIVGGVKLNNCRPPPLEVMKMKPDLNYS